MASNSRVHIGERVVVCNKLEFPAIQVVVKLFSDQPLEGKKLQFVHWVRLLTLSNFGTHNK